MSLLSLLSTAALAIVAAACLVHLKAMPRGVPWCSRLGFSLVFSGSIGAACEFYWPALEHYFSDQVLYCGMALVALSVLRGDLRQLLARVNGGWDGRDRRRPPNLAAVFANAHRPSDRS